MAAKPDLVMPIAKCLAEVINARPSSPSLEELRAHLRDAYLSAMSTVTTMPAEMRTRLAESMAAPRAEAVLALINAKPSSPTAEEIRNVLAPPRTPVSLGGRGCPLGGRGRPGSRGGRRLRARYVDDCDLCPAASAYIPRLQKTRPDLAGPLLWHEAITLAREAGLSIDPLD